MKVEDTLTSQDYWDDLWKNSVPGGPFNPDLTDLGHYWDRKRHECFSAVLGRGEGRRLLEVGCARSPFLPYFANRLGFSVAGLDYSPTGCQQTEALLKHYGVTGETFCADLFSPPAELIEAFDVTCSFGVVEHFKDTVRCLSALSRYLKSGGLLLTIIPNLSGLNGFLQHHFNRVVYDYHIAMDADQLAKAHSAARLEVDSYGYIGTFDLRHVDISNWPWRRLRRLTNYGQTKLSRLMWRLEAPLRIRPNRWTSPAIYCVAHRPA